MTSELIHKRATLWSTAGTANLLIWVVIDIKLVVVCELLVRLNVAVGKNNNDLFVDVDTDYPGVAIRLEEGKGELIRGTA
jgi:hypothetical protein